MIKRQRFTAEFKREAVRLLDAGERPASEVAIDLGIRRNQLYKCSKTRVRVHFHHDLGNGPVLPGASTSFQRACLSCQRRTSVLYRGIRNPRDAITAAR